MAADHESRVRLLSLGEAAVRLGVAPRTVSIWLKEGRYPFLKLGGEVRIAEADLADPRYRLLSLAQVADLLGFRPVTLRRWIKDGRLPSQEGPSWRISVSDLIEWVESRKQGGTS